MLIKMLAWKKLVGITAVLSVSVLKILDLKQITVIETETEESKEDEDGKPTFLGKYA
jgi:hypothetical protein